MSTTPPPPPPPEDPFPPFSNGEEGNDPFATGEIEQPLDQGRPSVAANPGRVAVVMLILGAVVLFLLYNIFLSGDDEEVKVEEPKAATVAPATQPPAPPPIPEDTPVALPGNFTAPP
ncbi:MAG: hypothetical protein DI582_03500, partial [Azospirillum brasilense]